MGLVSGPPIEKAGMPARELAPQRRDLWGITNAGDLIPQRQSYTSPLPVVTDETALRNSAVWACLRLRADLVSTFPVDVFRKTTLPDGNQIAVQAPTPPVLVNPEGPGSLWPQWAYATQWDLDKVGNCVGLITERDGFGLPKVIELQPHQICTALMKGTKIRRWRIGGTEYDPADVWHEKQFAVPGFALGLSPVGYAAWQTLSRFMAIEQFAIAWFAGGGVPRARLRNLQKTINATEANVVKEAWRASLATGEPFVHGNDWEYDLLQANEAGSNWLDAQRLGTVDIARYFGCPADLIDAAVQGAARITYANVAQRHVQLLILYIGPAAVRREAALSTLTQAPRYVKFNTKALLRLDPLAQAQMVKTMIDSRTLTPDEGREFDDRPPLTQAQIDQFLTFWPPKTGSSDGGSEPAAGGPAGGPDQPGGPGEPGTVPGEP
jgi:HK97 family phage portal protein